MSEAVANKACLLVVEDNEINMLVLRLMLQAAGYDLIEATDGLSAIEIAHSKNPDLVIMDIMMPGMDGISAAREILRNCAGKSPKLLAVTGNVLESVRQECLDAGFDGIIFKPVHAPELIATIERLLPRNGTVHTH